MQRSRPRARGELQQPRPPEGVLLQEDDCDVLRVAPRRRGHKARKCRFFFALLHSSSEQLECKVGCECIAGRRAAWIRRVSRLVSRLRNAKPSGFVAIDGVTLNPAIPVCQSCLRPASERGERRDRKRLDQRAITAPDEAAGAAPRPPGEAEMGRDRRRRRRRRARGGWSGR